MLGDGSQYKVRYFWKSPNFDQLLTLRPLICCRSIFKRARQSQTISKHIIFVNMGSHILEILGNMCTAIWEIADS